MFTQTHPRACPYIQSDSQNKTHVCIKTRRKRRTKSSNTSRQPFPLLRRRRRQQQQQISVHRVIKTHRNQGCRGTQVRLIGLIVQSWLKNGCHISSPARGTRASVKAYDCFCVFFLQNLLRLVRRKLEHGRNHFGHCLQMRSQERWPKDFSFQRLKCGQQFWSW